MAKITPFSENQKIITTQLSSFQIDYKYFRSTSSNLMTFWNALKNNFDQKMIGAILLNANKMNRTVGIFDQQLIINQLDMLKTISLNSKHTPSNIDTKLINNDVNSAICTSSTTTITATDDQIDENRPISTTNKLVKHTNRHRRLRNIYIGS